MTITIVSAVFPPENIVSAKTSHDLAIELANQNHFVNVITNFPNRPAGKLLQGYRRRLYQWEKTSEKFKVLRCWSTLSPKSTLFSRLLENITFGLSSSLAVLFLRKPDVIYANTWPIFAQGLTCLAARLRRIPIVLSIQDIYPESLAVQGRIKRTSLIYRWMQDIDRWNANSASRIIVLSERFVTIFIDERKIPAEKVDVIPNWENEEEIKILPRNECRGELNIPDDAFLLVYAGNIGEAAGVETIIQAMGLLPENSRVRLLIAGEGSQLTDCQKLAEQIGYGRISFHSPWLTEETSLVLGSADMLVLPTKGKQSLVSMPSKLITYLLAAKPILAVACSESNISGIIDEVRCGWVVEPDDNELLVKKINEISNTPINQLEEMGNLGRDFACRNFSRAMVLPQLIEIIKSTNRKM